MVPGNGPQVLLHSLDLFLPSATLERSFQSAACSSVVSRLRGVFVFIIFRRQLVMLARVLKVHFASSFATYRLAGSRIKLYCAPNHLRWPTWSFKPKCVAWPLKTCFVPWLSCYVVQLQDEVLSPLYFRHSSKRTRDASRNFVYSAFSSGIYLSAWENQAGSGIKLVTYQGLLCSLALLCLRAGVCLAVCFLAASRLRYASSFDILRRNSAMLACVLSPLCVCLCNLCYSLSKRIWF